MQWGTELQGGHWSNRADSCRHAQATEPKKTVTPEDTETQGAGQDLEEYKAAKLRQKENQRIELAGGMFRGNMCACVCLSPGFHLNLG